MTLSVATKFVASYAATSDSAYGIYYNTAGYTLVEFNWLDNTATLYNLRAFESKPNS